MTAVELLSIERYKWLWKVSMMRHSYNNNNDKKLDNAFSFVLYAIKFQVVPFWWGNCMVNWTNHIIRAYKHGKKWKDQIGRKIVWLGDSTAVFRTLYHEDQNKIWYNWLSNIKPKFIVPFWRTHNVNNTAAKSCICTNSIICSFCTSAIFQYLELTFLLVTYFAIDYPRSMKNIAGMQIWL